MANYLSMLPLIGKLWTSESPTRVIDLPSVQIHQIETSPERRARCLKHLLKANHVNYAILFNNRHFHNHNPHFLGSLYFLGANEKQLQDTYESEVKLLDPWRSSPAEIIDIDWRDFLGDKRYERAFVDFFEDKLAMKFAYDWKKELAYFLFSDETPLFYALTGGLGHPLIHLGYAFEMDSKEVAMEALGLSCTEYGFMVKYLEDAAYTRPSPLGPNAPLELITRLADDPRFKEQNVAIEALEDAFAPHEDIILEYWNAWDVRDPKKQFELSQKAAVTLLMSKAKRGDRSFDFFLVHVLTTSHAVRILLPFVPHKHHVTLVREWWLFAIAVCVLRGRPMPESDYLEEDLNGKDWSYVERMAISSPSAKDVHYVKALRAIKEAAQTWGDPRKEYLKAAVIFADDFKEWSF